MQAAGHVLRRLAARQQQLLVQAGDAVAEATANRCLGGRQLAAAAGQPGVSNSSSRAFSAYASSSSSSSPGRGFRRVNPGAANGSSSSSSTAEAAAAGEAGAGSSSSDASLIEMSREVPGGSKPLFTWEKWYWGLGVGGVSYFLYTRLKTPDKTPEEIEEAERKTEELRQRRKEHMRAVLMAQNFLEGDSDPLEGLSPAQIVMFMEKYNIDPTDPLEGLTPDEIDAYMQQQEAKRQGEQQETEQEQ